MAKTPNDEILVETTILVDFLRGSDAAAEYLDASRAEAALICSAITSAELIVGATSRAELRSIDQLLARFQIEPITASDSTLSLKWLRKYFHTHGVGYHDCLLGAAAVRREATVATLNVKHFKALPGVKVIKPY
jgi:predicted nucleic acid-binding protein